MRPAFEASRLVIRPEGTRGGRIHRRNNSPVKVMTRDRAGPESLGILASSGSLGQEREPWRRAEAGLTRAMRTQGGHHRRSITCTNMMPASWLAGDVGGG